MRIDLNADVGESYGVYSLGDDSTLMRSVTSVSVATGFHAGDPSVLRRTIRLARDLGVAIGAHPSFPDLAGFGRREMTLSSEDAEDMVLYQLAAVSGIARAEGVAMMHVKPHGALYNMAARDRQLAESIARAAYAAGPELAIFAPPRSALAAAARAIGLRVVIEGFPIGRIAPTDLSFHVQNPTRSSSRLKTSSTVRFRWQQAALHHRRRWHAAADGRGHDLHPRRHRRCRHHGNVDSRRTHRRRRRSRTAF
ncbi:MAG: 5-oxoprolinase subunit PxpA [Vicinamibacterales bacterium]